MTLLDECQQVLERTYRPVGVDLGECVIGRQRLPQLVEASGMDPDHFSSRAFTFMRPSQNHLYLALYYHPEVIDELEAEDPRESISHRNINSLIDFIEEITHGAHAAWAFRAGFREEVFQSEAFACAMEIQARVDTYFLILRYLARLLGHAPNEAMKEWVRHQVLHRDSWQGVPEFLRRRYRLAAVISERFIGRLSELPAEQRILLIRSFRKEGVWGKWKLARAHFQRGN